jgi:hypothetical protein
MSGLVTLVLLLGISPEAPTLPAVAERRGPVKVGDIT